MIDVLTATEVQDAGFMQWASDVLDRAGDPAMATTRLDLAERLLSWRQRHDDRTLTGHRITRRGLAHRRDPRR